MGKKNIEIEILRGIAIMMVIVAHLNTFWLFPFPKYIANFWTGVDLFFVISGFVVTESLLKTLPEQHDKIPLRKRIQEYKKPIKAFFIRRFFRIAPLSIVWAVLPLIFSAAFGGPDSFFSEPKYVYQSSLAGLSFAYNYLRFFFQFPPKLDFYWSLSVEEHFYFILPFVFLFLPTTKRRALFFISLVLVVSFIFRTNYFTPSTNVENAWFYLSKISHNRMDSIGIGVLLKLFTLIHPVQLRLNKYGHFFSRTIVIGCFFILVWLPSNYHEHSGLHLLFLWLALISTLPVYLSSLNLEYGFAHTNILNRALAFIGNRSYGYYLLHWQAIGLTIFLFQFIGLSDFNPKINSIGSPNIPWLLVYVAIVASLGEFGYHLIEAPTKRYGKLLSTKSLSNI